MGARFAAVYSYGTWNIKPYYIYTYDISVQIEIRFDKNGLPVSPSTPFVVRPEVDAQKF